MKYLPLIALYGHTTSGTAAVLYYAPRLHKNKNLKKLFVVCENRFIYTSRYERTKVIFSQLGIRSFLKIYVFSFAYYFRLV
jgi:hypothetical protein